MKEYINKLIIQIKFNDILYNISTYNPIYDPVPYYYIPGYYF